MSAGQEAWAGLASEIERLEAEKAIMLRAMKDAHAIIGDIPSPPDGLGTQEPAYRAFSILETAIEKIEAADQTQHADTQYTAR